MSVDAAPKKVFIVALDGATLDLLRPWAEAGKLPLFHKIFAAGVVGELRSTIPPVTPVAWTSFMTGKNPGRHGIFDLFRPIRADYSEVIPTYGDHCTERTLWQILSDRGRKVGLVNVPMTYPPKPVKGFVISGVPAPVNKESYSYPASVLRELQQMGWDLTRDASMMIGSYDENLASLRELIEVRTQATLHLMEQSEWDVFMVHFLETDQVQHIYWRFMDTNEGPSPDTGESGKAILELFQHVEVSLARICQSLDEDTIVIMVSDHGMGPTRYHVYLNNWLLQEGLMTWKRRWSTRYKRALSSVGINPTSIYSLLPTEFVRRFAAGRLRAEMSQMLPEGSRSRSISSFLAGALWLSLNDVDWSATSAYSTGTMQAGFIYVNLKGREPQGIVEDGREYENLRHSIRARLLDYIDPLTGRKIFAQVHFREEVYSGPYVSRAPDIIVICGDPEFNTPMGRLFLSNKVVAHVHDANAAHRMNGLFAMVGQDIARTGCSIVGAEIIDVAPTILYLLGEEIPSDMDGKVLTNCLTAEFLQAHPMKYVEPSSRGEMPAKEGEEMSSEDLQSMRRTLEGLGYI
ncbi:MAG: alkaline phosphatase family protein [Anaerolineae bacterium]